MSQYEAMKPDKAIIIRNRGYTMPELISRAILSNREMITEFTLSGVVARLTGEYFERADEGLKYRRQVKNIDRDPWLC